jgi:hypothetical protein
MFKRVVVLSGSVLRSACYVLGSARSALTGPHKWKLDTFEAEQERLHSLPRNRKEHAMRRILTCGALLFVCWTVVAFAFAQEPGKLGAAVKNDPLDRLLAEFATATGRLDIERAERLFLPPDDTLAGKNRRTHLSELRKDWQRAKESGEEEGPAVQFKNVKKVIRTQMVISGPGGPREGEVIESEFTVASTRDGWKIVSMEMEVARGK